MKRIAIVGLGQIGGSIVLSLRKNRAPYHITGIETSKARLRLLKPYLDASSQNWNDTDVIVLCLHYDQTAEFLKTAPQGKLITDVCSGKSKLVKIANQKKMRFVGGHPMAGNEFQAEKGWRDNLFADAPYFIAPAKHASKQDVAFVKTFARYLGAKPHLIDAEMHDRCVAITSHFPAFLSQMIQQSKVPEIFQGPGFRSMTRLAKTSPSLLATFLQSNQTNIIEAAEKLQERLDDFISNVQTRRRKE